MGKKTEMDKIEEKITPRKKSTSKVVSEQVEAKIANKTTTKKTIDKKAMAKKTTTKNMTTKKTTAKKATAKKATTTKTTRKKTTKETPSKTKTATKKTVREVEREQTVQAEKIESREFYRRNRKSDSKKSLRIAKAGKRRILKANKRAKMVESIGKMKARNQASKGKYVDARKISRKAIERSDRIIQKAITKNTKSYGKFERKRAIKELVKTTASEINKEYKKDKMNSVQWTEKKPDSRIVKIVNGLGNADISVKRFTAKADMGIASLYANVANSMGFSNHAKMVIEEISMAAEERVRLSRVDNEKARLNVDRVFGFAERRRKNLESAETFIKDLSRGVMTGISEGYTHLNDDLASWIEDIEHKMSQPMPKRNYNLAFASGGSISNSFQVRSRNAMSFVEGSLTGIRSDRMYQTNQRNNTLGRYGEYR